MQPPQPQDLTISLININMRCIEMYGQVNPLQPQMD